MFRGTDASQAVGEQSRPPHTAKYRPDIDGLRALAVLAVVIFHFKREALGNGYLGVDIFFVLSGYLITGIIARELQGGIFSLRRFYERRLRRLAPTLLCVLAVTTAVACLLLLPVDLAGYGRSLLATIFFSSNVYFWRDTNYFARSAEEKPLLHTWSLSIEEQFYLVFPLVLLALHRLVPTWTRYIVLVATVGSLAGYLIANRIGAESPAFFLLPTRAWELGAGATLALFAARAPSGIARHVAGVAGLALIMLALAAVEWTPGYALAPAVPVVVGTLLLIWSGEGGPITSALFSHPLAVHIGRISYSMYLWHWPLVVFATYYLVRDLTWAEAAGAFVLLWGLSVLSLRYVETPARGSSISIRTVATRCAAGVLVLVLAGTALIVADGIPSRMRPDAARINAAVGTNYRCPIGDYLAFGRSRACTLNLPSRSPADAEVVLLGNSHAQMYAPLVEGLLKDAGTPGLLVPANACAPMEGVNISADCITTMRTNIEAVMGLPKARTIILSFDWPDVPLVDASGNAVTGDRMDAMIAGLDETIARFQAAGHRVVLVGPIAIPGWDVASVLSRSLNFQRPLDSPLATPAADFAESTKGRALAHYAGRNDIALIQPHQVQCDEVECRYLLDGESLFADSNHLAQGALDHFEAEFRRAFMEAGLLK